MSHAESLRQQARWVREALDPATDPDMRITLDDVDTEELDAAVDHLEALEARLEKASEGLAEILNHCANTGRGNEIVDSRIVDRVDDTARRTLAEIDTESEGER